MTSGSSDVHEVASALADAAKVPLVDVEYPSSPSGSKIADTDASGVSKEWSPPPGFWSAEAPPSRATVVLEFKDREQVAGIVPGDGVWLHEHGLPHSVGRVSAVSVKDSTIRVLIEGVLPLPAE